MTEQLVETAVAEIPTAAATPQIAAPAPVLISEGEVLLSTAAAVHPLPRISWASRVVLAVRRAFATPAATPVADRHTAAKQSRMGYLDHSAMEREMHRL